MRMLLTLILLHLATSLSKETAQNIVQSSSSIIPAKLPSRRNHGRTIERLIGGHVLFNREVYRNLRNINIKKSNSSSNLHAFNRDKNIHLTDNNDIDDELLLITASAGNGNGKEATNSTKKEESKKTLSDQVAEGKYGLIHKELFTTTPKRPGVLSYKSNSEVPKDDARNYGGLEDEEIWLAEDHLLVLKGGSVNKNNNKPKWRPIDDYDAPTRQVKLPLNPKVPPPFPVQLTDDGPIQFIGNNQLPVYNPFTNQTVFLFSNERVPDIKADDLNKKNPPPWNGKDGPPSQFNGYQYPPPAPLPLGKPNQTFSNPFLNLPPLPPFPLPPPGSYDERNTTDIDEDDPSLYYPPPYSFEYKSNYSNPVSPGPLVPGIILPPPPNFFAPLDEDKKPIKTPLDVLNKINDIKLRERLKNTTSSPIVTTTIKNLLTTSPTKPMKIKPQRVETPSYKIEIEKVNIRKFPENNETTVLRTVRPPNIMSATTTIAPPTKKRIKVKPPSQTRTQLHKINAPIAPPLISLSPDNIKGNPIYFEYFDARTPTSHPFEDFSITTPLPYLTTLTDVSYNNHYQPTTVNPLINQPVVKPKRPPSKTYLPTKSKDLPYNTPDAENYRYKTMQEFNREIETIRQTLRLYEQSVPIINNIRTPKARPIYDFSIDLRPPITSPVQTYHSPISINPFNHQAVSTQPLKNDFRPTALPYNSNFYNHHPANFQPIQTRPLQHYDKPDLQNNYKYRDHSVNVEITSASPHSGYTPFTTPRPVYYDQQPNWYSIEKVRVHEIPKPLIYNNGASGYNPKLYLPAIRQQSHTAGIFQ
ncbi:uncharacterized protein LOC134205282 isoform X2 [Armigeres subalbatus]|uniref:uncharacterized protein LOC134205282 isoform X2 n=1 Tax=Armigeres subalbatus TaxID=124917 RepID=UPI002ED48DE1